MAESKFINDEFSANEETFAGIFRGEFMFQLRSELLQLSKESAIIKGSLPFSEIE